MSLFEEYPNPPTTLEQVITHIEATDEASWCTDVVRSAEDGRNCFFGHLFNMGADDAEGSAIWDWFECRWMTTYGMYPINDGQNPKYRQPTPKQRCVAALHALRDGTELATMESMDQEYEASLTLEAV